MTTETMTQLVRSVDVAHTEVNKRTGIVRAVVSDDSRDRFDTRFDPEGCEWDGWQAGGSLVLYEHGRGNRGQLPVGNVVEGPERTTFKGRRSIVTGTKFWESDDFSKQIGEAYKSLAMRSWSINAIPLQQSPPTPAERRAGYDCAMVYRHWSLVELSVVSCAGNTSANTIEVLRSGAGVQPAVTRAEWLARELAPKVNRLLKEASGGAAEGMSVDELKAMIQKLELELHLGTLQSALERQENWKRWRAEY